MKAILFSPETRKGAIIKICSDLTPALMQCTILLLPTTELSCVVVPELVERYLI